MSATETVQVIEMSDEWSGPQSTIFTEQERCQRRETAKQARDFARRLDYGARLLSRGGDHEYA